MGRIRLADRRLLPILCACLGATGVLALAVTLPLPWREAEFRVGVGVRMTMAAAGLAILWTAARSRAEAGVRVGMTVLGTSVLAYPTLLTLGAAERGPELVGVLGDSGHVLPLTMTQLLPVLVSAQVTGRSRRAWKRTIITVAILGVAATGTGLALGEAGTVLLVPATVAWMVSFGFAPVANWTAVRGTFGETRRRAIVAGLAALVPLLIITWCVSLGALGEAFGLPDADTSTTLFLGFSAATAGCAFLSAAALTDLGSPLLRTPVVLWLLRSMLVGGVILAATALALVASALLPTQGAAMLVAVIVTLAMGWAAVRLLIWAADVVDPAAELRRELTRSTTTHTTNSTTTNSTASNSTASNAPASIRRTSLQIMRRLAEDPDLELLFSVGPATWVDSFGTPVSANPQSVGTPLIALTDRDEPATILLRTGDPRAHRRAQGWRECHPLLVPALIEAREQWQAGRAALAAREERARLQQDLHDGLQGRLLGLALNLQMSQGAISDPMARLAIEETVAGLRGAVEDVRAMAGGRLPRILVDDGLESAVRALLQPVQARIGSLHLDQSGAGRPPAVVEACAYYVVSESVGNAVKHTDSDRIEVSITVREDRSLVVRVSDDGAGGAQMQAGSGLRGLGERVGATGGILLVSDRDGGGTVVEAVLPCGS